MKSTSDQPIPEFSGSKRWPPFSGWLCICILGCVLMEAISTPIQESLSNANDRDIGSFALELKKSGASEAVIDDYIRACGTGNKFQGVAPIQRRRKIMETAIRNFEVLPGDKAPIKAWTKGVLVEDEAKQQLANLSTLPFIFKHIAVMPDVHAGCGSTIGSVIPTKGAIIPAAVGVDLGCGMTAVKTGAKADNLPDNLRSVRDAIESVVPCGRTDNGGPNDRGAWHDIPLDIANAWEETLLPEWNAIVERHPELIGKRGVINHVNHLGTLGTGNHFIEMCADDSNTIWLVLHSGSRGVGNRIGNYFIDLARKDMERYFVNLPDRDLAYLPEGSKYFEDYIQAITWAQKFAHFNRTLMMSHVRQALLALNTIPGIYVNDQFISCHHNYAVKENHFGANVWVTRKGAVRARKEDFGIIPGSMGVGSFIVKGKGNPESFNSCSHGAGRTMSRTKARATISLEQHERDTAGIECRKDLDVLDESPSAYKPLSDVMAAQNDLVEIAYRLRPLACVKG